MSSNSRSTAKNKINNDPADELKRRSRRRLVGSIALFLAAIIIVPALVENEPDQTPSAVELVVPERPSSETHAAAQPAPAEQTHESPKAVQEHKSVPAAPAVEPSTPVAEPKVEPKTEPKPKEKPEPRVEAKPAPKVESAKPEPKTEPKAEPKAEPKPAEDPIAAFAKTEVYWVQVAAVSDRARADSLSKELEAKGFSAKVVSAASGTVFRVRVGPLSGQGKADETKAKLAGAGYSSGRIVQ